MEFSSIPCLMASTRRLRTFPNSIAVISPSVSVAKCTFTGFFSPEPNPCRTRLAPLALRSAWRSVPSRSHASIRSKTSNVAVIAVDMAGVSEAASVTGGPGRFCDLPNCCCFTAAIYKTRSSSSPDPSLTASNDFLMIHSLDGELIPTVPSGSIPPAVGTRSLLT